MKKRILVTILSFVILILIVGFFISKFGNILNKNDKIIIITTIYPEYDFVSHIVGDKMNVIRLIEPGVEIHTYEPTTRDMMKISDAKAFVYTGKAMEPWAEQIIDVIEEKGVVVVDTSKNIDMINSDKFMEEYSLLENSHEEEEHSEHEELDGHIWMNPKNAVIMIDTILGEIIKIDPENKEYYEKNANEYKEEILKLDKEIEYSLKENNIDTLVFGGEFSYAYFCERYDLNVVSCYTACGEHSDPSIATIQKVVDFINDNNIPAIYYEELSTGQVSQIVAEETNTESRVFNTIHNVTIDEINSNENYVTIMRKNLEAIIKK